MIYLFQEKGRGGASKTVLPSQKVTQIFLQIRKDGNLEYENLESCWGGCVCCGIRWVMLVGCVWGGGGGNGDRGFEIKLFEILVSEVTGYSRKDSFCWLVF